jgi:hypothetical protein
VEKTRGLIDSASSVRGAGWLAGNPAIGYT